MKSGIIERLGKTEVLLPPVIGEGLDGALGREAVIDFLQLVLRVSAEALLKVGSIRFVRDRIETEPVRHLQRVGGTLLAVVVRQADLACARLIQV
jgi:hypothetical protein